MAIPRDHIDDVWYDHLLALDMADPSSQVDVALGNTVDGLVNRGFELRLVTFSSFILRSNNVLFSLDLALLQPSYPAGGKFLGDSSAHCPLVESRLQGLPAATVLPRGP